MGPPSAGVIFPRFHGHQVKSPSPSLRTQQGNDSHVSNADGLDDRTLRSIQKYPAWPRLVCGSAYETRARFSTYERIFDDRIVPTVSTPTHARRPAVTGQHLAVPNGGVLGPAVRMVHHATRRSSVFEGHGERRHGQLLSEAAPHPPGNDPTRVEIEHNRQIEPALDPSTSLPNTSLPSTNFLFV